MQAIEILKADSIAEITAFDRLCFPLEYWKEADWRELLNDPRAVYYAVRDGGKIIGDVFIYNWQGEDDYVKIMNLAVHPDYRGLGIAHRLLSHVTEELSKSGMKRFCGDTRASNHAMQKVFSDCGYRFECVKEHYFENPAEDGYKYLLVL